MNTHVRRFLWGAAAIGVAAGIVAVLWGLICLILWIGWALGGPMLGLLVAGAIYGIGVLAEVEAAAQKRRGR